MAYDPVSVSNMGLDAVPAERIASFEEASLEAKQCSFWYPRSLSLLLEKHPWSWARRRVALAEVANDRLNEWRYAYAKPAGQAFVVAVFPAAASPSGYIPTIGIEAIVRQWPYVLAGEIIYSNAPDAVLEYTAGEAVEPLFTGLFADALGLEIGARVCMPISKSRERRREMVAEADTALQRAIAHDLNQQQQSYGQPFPEADAAWLGWGEVSQYQRGF